MAGVSSERPFLWNHRFTFRPEDDLPPPYEECPPPNEEEPPTYSSVLSKSSEVEKVQTIILHSAEISHAPSHISVCIVSYPTEVCFPEDDECRQRRGTYGFVLFFIGAVGFIVACKDLLDKDNQMKITDLLLFGVLLNCLWMVEGTVLVLSSAASSYTCKIGPLENLMQLCFRLNVLVIGLTIFMILDILRRLDEIAQKMDTKIFLMVIIFSFILQEYLICTCLGCIRN